MTKEERRLLKEQEEEFKQKAKERHDEIKRLTAEHKQEVKEAKRNRPKAAKKKQIKRAPITRTLLDVFPIRDYQNKDDHFVTEDGSIIDLFQIRGRSYYKASDEEVEDLVERLTSFFRMYKSDLKFIAMNYPTNTKNQQAFLTYKLQQPELAQYEDLINEKLATLQYLEENTTDREAFVFVFADSTAQYETLCGMLNRSDFHVMKIDQQKKENIVFQLNNMCKRVKL